MTPRRKRMHRLPREERPSNPSQDHPASSGAGESEIYFPSLESNEAGFTPLPARLPDDEPIRLPGIRRRRRQTALITRPDSSELDERLESMARRVAPTFDFFLFSLLAGVILGVGYLFDAPAVLLFGLLVTPILAPWAGAALAASIGELRFFGQTFGGFFIALFIIFVTGLLAGLVFRLFPPAIPTQALLHAQFGLFDLLLAAAGAVGLAIAFVRSDDKPLLANLMVAYGIYLPASAAGFGMGSGLENIWLQALPVLLVHLAISIVLALIVFYYMGFRPLEASGYALIGLIAIVGLAAVLAGWSANLRANPSSLTPVPLVTLTPADSSPVSQATFTALPAQPTSTRTSTPTVFVTPSPTSLPTPEYGRVGPNGAHIRDEPGGDAITTLEKGYLVEILPEEPAILEGTTWVRVRVQTPNRDVVGWVRLDLIATATPSGPLPTPTLESTPTVTVTLEASGSYAVVNITEEDATLNVRSGAGVTNPLVGSLAYRANNIGRVGSPVTVNSTEWWQIQKTDGLMGWVNASYLTEFIAPDAFCEDGGVTTLLTDLGTALKNNDGAALAVLVSPRHGVDVRLAPGNAPINYTRTEAADVFTSVAIQNWGPGAANDGNVGGTFKGIMLPKLLDVYNAAYQLDCNDTSNAGPVGEPWPSEYTSINFYSIYKPATDADTNWRDFLAGVEYVDGQPYLFSLVHFERGSGQ